MWGDRGLTSKLNSAMLERREIGEGFCPRDVAELSNRLVNKEGFREGLKRRVGTEARIEIYKNVFLGRPLLAKGFKHRELVVGWAALTHSLWVVARMAEAQKKRKRGSGTKHPSAASTGRLTKITRRAGDLDRIPAGPGNPRPNRRKTKIRRTEFGVIAPIQPVSAIIGPARLIKRTVCGNPAENHRFRDKL